MARIGYGNKFHAKKVKEDGYTFDSIKEYNRYKQLKLLDRGHAIRDLQVHVPYELIAKSSYGRQIKYVADFTYYEGDEFVVEDTKGCKVGSAYQIFKLKKRLFAEKYGIVIRET